MDKLAFAVNLTLEELAARKAEADQQIAELDDTNCELQGTNKTLVETQERLRHVGKLAALGEISAMLAHELTQPLTAILMNAALLLEPGGEVLSDASRQSIEEMAESGHRMRDVIQNLRRFSRDDSLVPRPTDALAPLEGALTLFRHQFHRQRIQCSVRAPDQLPKVFVDPSFTQQVFINLLSNARDALSGLSAESARWVDIRVRAQPDAVLYLLRNNGPEIPEELRERLFEAFFTTKTDESGTGLGLSLSRDLVERQRGTLELRPDPDATCFAVRLPIKHWSLPA